LYMVRRQAGKPLQLLRSAGIQISENFGCGLTRVEQETRI
jgi:hypothetical protein